MARTITYDKEPVTRFNEIFHDTTTKTTNASSSSGAYSLSFASTSDFTVATEDFPGDLVSGTNIQKGSRVVAKDSSSITLNKPITGTINSGDNVTLYSSMKALDGGPQGFALLQGTGITLTPTNSNNAGVPTVTLASTASGADGMGAGFVISDGSTTDTITTSETVTFGGTGVDATVSSGAVNYSLDLHELTDTAVATADSIAFIDADDNSTKKDTIVDFISTTQGLIDAVGTLTGLTVGTESTRAKITNWSNEIDIDATTHYKLGAPIIELTAQDDSFFKLTADAAANKTLTIDASNADSSGTATIAIGTTSATAVNIGASTSEVTFGDNVTVTGNLTVNGTQTIINTSEIVAEDKTIVLGIAGGMEEATYSRSGTTVTVTSTSHGFNNNEFVFINAATGSSPPSDNVYQITSVSDADTFTFTSDTTGSLPSQTLYHSSDNVTEGTADTSGIYAPGTSLHSIQYDSSNGWSISDDLDLASGKHLSINGATTLTSTALGTAVVSSSLTSVDALDGGSITSNFGSINTGSSAISTTGTLTGGDIVGTSLNVSGNIEGTGTLSLNNGTNTISATELNVLGGVTAGTVTASKVLTVDASRDVATIGNLTADGALEADGLQLTGGANSAADSATVVAIMDVSEATNVSGTAATAFTIANYAFGTYRTAKFIVQVSNGTDTDCMEVLVTYEGASAPAASANIFLTTYAYVTTAASDLGTIDAVKGTTTIDLQFTPTADGTYSYSVVNTLLIK